MEGKTSYACLKKGNDNAAVQSYCFICDHAIRCSPNTYEGVVRIMQHAPAKQNGEDGLPIPPYKVYNIGNNSPENLLDFVTILQQELVRAGVLPKDYDFEAHKELVPMQPGDVPVTYADTTPLEQDFGFKPNTSLREGLRQFAEWYTQYFSKNICC